MLISRSQRDDSPENGIHNYYRPMVMQQLQSALTTEQLSDAELLADVACVALNHLPPRYVRHDVDMAFYLSSAERAEMEDKVKAAVNQAIEFVASRRQRN